jgi:proteasome lid subunit RPN8/RPN11
VTLVMPGGERRRIEAHLVGAYPEEGCGVMIGLEREGRREIRRAIPFENRRPDSRANRYLIAPEQFLAAENEARAAGLDVLGFFHSHPDHPAQPSAFDLEHAWPYYSYVIMSIVQGRPADLRAWRLADDRSRFAPETIEMDEPSPAAASEPGETR